MNEIEPHMLGQQDFSSDMLLALENLERMFHAYRYCMNEHAANAVLFGMSIETQMLALKMKTMLGRWNVYLPFHEVMDVNFAHWHKQVGEWIEVLQGNDTDELQRKYTWLVGCIEYMLDLYVMLDGDAEKELCVSHAQETDMQTGREDCRQEVSAYMEQMTGLHREMMERDNSNFDWRGEVDRMAIMSLTDACVKDRVTMFPARDSYGLLQKVEQDVRKRFEMLGDLSDVADCALIALYFLHKQLGDLQALFCNALPNEMFTRLSIRLFYRHCMPSYHEGESEVNRWRNTWPEAKLKSNAGKKKEELIALLTGKPYGTELQEYISVDAPDLFGESNFGRFLHKSRGDLRVEDLKYIHKVCREINLLNELIGQEGSVVETHSAPIRQLEASEQEILEKLTALARSAEWRNISEDVAVNALHKALGLGPVFLDAKLMGMSQSLWNMLKKRRGCDAEKSLRLTWLNIVGYCLSKGFMNGHAPALAKSFFPHCGKDDYKAIDKGRNARDNKNFLAVIPLLDACFRD